jgi:DNA-directed RNA polymerase subunit RPC12/RpoP
MMNQPIAAVPVLKPAMPESHERRCPYCKHDRVAPVGHLIASGWMIRVEYRCEACETAFLVVEPSII